MSKNETELDEATVLVNRILELCNDYDKRVPIDEIKDLLRETHLLAEDEDEDEDEEDNPEHLEDEESEYARACGESSAYIIIDWNGFLDHYGRPTLELLP